MSFNSYGFLFAFLPITALGFWTLLKFAARSWAIAWLLLASVVFYLAASPITLVLITPSILIDYSIGRILLRLDVSRKELRNAWFALGIVANLVFLGYFKYTAFLLQTSNALLGTHWEAAPTVLPLGISFLVFQKLAFLADVKSGQLQAIRLRDFLLFTLFFPRTIAGPIVHYKEVMPQIQEARSSVCATHIAVGLCLLSIGLFKKTVIADHLSQLPALVFDSGDAHIPDHTLLISWLGLLTYTLQLYFDFSGYSDMALGAARMVGIRLPMNFNSPFKAASIVEFWSRWHITLTRFLTAYIYTPLLLHLTRARLLKGEPVLSGRRSKLSAIATLIALPNLVTMAISGLWHGAGWQFVAWGALHGVYLMINQIWRLRHPRSTANPGRYGGLRHLSAQALTFASVIIALTFFRSSSVRSALSVLAGLAGFNGVLPHEMQVLMSAGVGLHWVWQEQQLLVTASLGVGVLMAAVMLLPNSLEILQRFEPALDFPSTGQSDRRSVDLSPATAVVASLLLMLGVMSLGQSGGFVYGQF